MTVSVFASGSGGNCALLSDGATHLLLDAGISLRRLRQSLAACELTPGELTAVLITHEHNDHIAGLPMLLKHHGVPVFAPRTVANHLRWSMAGADEFLHILPLEEACPLHELQVTAFPTSHDTDQSVGYRIEGSGVFGLCTDTGCVTEGMEAALPGCGTVLLEANHDEDMLLSGRYPPALKRRILSPRGHLSNESCASFACELAESGTSAFILGHLSQENNTALRARTAVASALERRGLRARIEIAPVFGNLTMEIAPCCV